MRKVNRRRGAILLSSRGNATVNFCQVFWIRICGEDVLGGDIFFFSIQVNNNDVAQSLERRGHLFTVELVEVLDTLLDVLLGLLHHLVDARVLRRELAQLRHLLNERREEDVILMRVVVVQLHQSCVCILQVVRQLCLRHLQGILPLREIRMSKVKRTSCADNNERRTTL